MKRAPITAIVGLALASGFALTAAAQSSATYQTVKRAARGTQEISSSQVRITPTTMRPGSTSIEIGDDRWNARGYDLKSLLSQIYDIDVRRIDLADDGLEDARWDVTLQLPRELDENAIQQVLEQALERKFALKIAPETRQMEVYVLTAPNGTGVALHRYRDAGGAMPVAQRTGTGSETDSDPEGQISYIGRDCSGVVSSSGIEASAATIGELQRTLEPDLNRLLVDETHLTGSYDFKIGAYSNQDELFNLMRQQLGIVVTPAQRRMQVLTVRPAQETRAAM